MEMLVDEAGNRCVGCELVEGKRERQHNARVIRPAQNGTVAFVQVSGSV